jgi:hypothetical protein
MGMPHANSKCADTASCQLEPLLLDGVGAVTQAVPPFSESWKVGLIVTGNLAYQYSHIGLKAW